ncbi:helix-turn-helix transcriptional regulator [Streptomyces sp. PRKS01-29]|nr:helix-turn-helix transcriptional regulator [Streptomyces sabulosicollis]MBI0294466.1 helix-turn-helix transcriptional regulator [Streptomyces sabulosicollis]
MPSSKVCCLTLHTLQQHLDAVKRQTSNAASRPSGLPRLALNAAPLYGGGMNSDSNGRQVAAIVGERLRALREAKDLRQEDVVTAAQSLGLTWGRSSVAALEAGNRSLSVGEFLLIPALVAQLGGWDEPLLSPTDRIVVSDSLTLSARRLTDAMIGYLTPVTDAAKVLSTRNEEDTLGAVPRNKGWDSVSPHKLNQSNARAAVYLRVLHTLKPDATNSQWLELIRLDYEITRTIANRLSSPKHGRGVDPLLARAFALSVYGRSLGEERDARAESRGPYPSKRALQSARGHATREIIEELQKQIDVRWKEIEPVFNELDAVFDDPDALNAWLKETQKMREGM